MLTWSDEGEIGVDLLERSRPLLALLPQGDVLGQAAIAHAATASAVLCLSDVSRRL